MLSELIEVCILSFIFLQKASASVDITNRKETSHNSASWSHGLLPMWPSHEESPAPKLLNMGQNISSLLVYWTDTSGHCFPISVFFMVTSADSALCADRPPGSLEAAGWQENKTQLEKKMFLCASGWMSKTKSETIICSSAVCSQCPYAALLIYLYNSCVTFCIAVEAAVFTNTECMFEAE